MKEIHRSKVYTDRPDYADFEPAAKFEAIKSIIAKHLKEHPNAICSYSGGADSDIIIDICEKIKPHGIHYVWFDTGIEFQATKEHLKYLENHYDITIERERERLSQFRFQINYTGNLFSVNTLLR